MAVGQLSLTCVVVVSKVVDRCTRGLFRGLQSYDCRRCLLVWVKCVIRLGLLVRWWTSANARRIELRIRAVSLV